MENGMYCKNAYFIYLKNCDLVQFLKQKRLKFISYMIKKKVLSLGPIG
jgi:hypothetical protein